MNLPDMQSSTTTLQEVFDFVCLHLLTQDGQSHDGMDCQYRGIDGRTCAVGCLIPDENYHKALEGENYREISHILDWDERFCNLLVRLQQIHDEESSWGPDGNGFTRLGAHKLVTAAKKHGLSAPLAVVLHDD